MHTTRCGCLPGAGLVLLFAALAEAASVNPVELPHELLTAEAQLDQIEQKTTGGKSGKGWFDKIKQQVSDLF